MKRKSPISVDRIQFYPYDCDMVDELAFIDQFFFDDRHDFLTDRFLSGIVVKVHFDNDRYDKGVRREVSLSFVDVSLRCEVASQRLKVNIRKDEFFKECYVNFSTETADIKPGHSYKLVVSDSTGMCTLAETFINLIDKQAFRHPSEWYEICDGGLRPAWESDMFKSIKAIDNHDYYVRFNLSPKFGALLPTVLPELELRLYHPHGTNIVSQFREPKCKGIDNYNDNLWFVEFPFSTSCDSHGVFYAELLCMEYPIAGFMFDTEGSDTRGKWFGKDLEPLDEYSPEAAAARWISLSFHSDDYGSDDFDKLLDRFISDELAKIDSDSEDDEQEQAAHESESDAQPKDDDNQESLISSLDNLTGLHAVKDKLAVYERVVRFNKMRADKGLPVSTTPLHAMFLGSPGTGKTTVAKLIGDMLRRAGVLSRGHVVVRERATLLGQNYNSESEKTLAAIEEAQGGILFIDEAYQLHQPNDPRDPGKFVIETLLTALSDNDKRDWMLVLAGYPDEMRRMFDLNPGFKSRIPDSNIYTFDDFTEAELIEIAENYFAGNNYTLTPDAREALVTRLNADYSQRGKNFGNARHVINMIQTEILPSMAVRVINEGQIDETSLTRIQKSDIPSPVVKTSFSRPRVGFAL